MMKQATSFLHSLTLLIGVAVAAAADNIPDLDLHEGESLDGGWHTIVDPYDSGFYDYRYNQRDASPKPSRAEAIFLDATPADPAERVEYGFEESPLLQVPGDWNTQRPELFLYEGTVWYRKTFDAAPLAAGERAFFRFGAANYRADVYLNGTKLGTHVGGFTPFTLEATGRLVPGRNSLVVRVNNQRAREAVPTLNTDWWNYGGLTRGVKFVRTPAAFIGEHRLWLDSVATKTISGWAQVHGAAAGERVEVEIPALGQVVSGTTDSTGRATFRLTVPDLEPWSPERPTLYDVCLTHAGRRLSDRIGFRTIATRSREILLNDRPIFLRGVCIHEEFPLRGGGRVTTAEQARQLLSWAKELGCNFVRLAHYPHGEDMTRLADELGLLVWSEVPVYWTIDWTSAATFINAETQLADNIRRDANRASIIIWSIGNETPVGEARNTFMAGLAAKARSLDSTRLVSAALEKHRKRDAELVQVVEDPLADLVDVVAFNQYVGWYDGLPEKCGRVRWEIPYDKPVIVSEFGGDAKAGFHGDASRRWTEEFQEDLYRQTLAMLDTIEGYRGCVPWLLVDFRSPKRLLPGIQDGFNRKGLISSEGERKKAFTVMQDYYRRKAAAAQ